MTMRKFRYIYISTDLSEQNKDMNMNISNINQPTMSDLPNEILFIIINKLNIGDIVYSLLDLDERFAQFVYDPIYIQNLDITDMTMNSYYKRSFSVHEQVLSRICENLLPKIRNQIKKLVIEQQSIERILTFNYSQLYSLSFVNFNEDRLLQYLTGMFLILNFPLFIFVSRLSNSS
jgi:hypothetical protein